MTMRPVPNEGHSNAAHWHTKWKAADAELDTLRRQLAEAEASAVEIERESREAWLQAANWRKRAESAEQFLRDARPLSSVELIVGESDDTVLTVTTTAGELRKLALAEQLLRDAFDSIVCAAKLAGIDPVPEPTPESIGGRIAAFIGDNRAAIAAGEGK